MTDKTFSTIVDTIARALYEVMEEGRALDQVTSFWIKQNSDWNSSNRGFFAETLMEVVRWWRLLDYCISKPSGENVNDSYRLLVLTYFLIKTRDDRAREYIPQPKQEVLLNQYAQVKGNSAIAESIPDWLNVLSTEEMGESWNKEIKALNSLPPIILRVNTLKTNREALSARLTQEGYLTEDLDAPDAIRLVKRADIFKSKAFLEGEFEIQDYSSQQVAPFLQVSPGMRVADACAGTGGKTLHLACLMKNKGKILALDSAEWKLGVLMKRASRAGAMIVEPRPITTTKVIKRLRESVDRLLLDVPCSGLGVLRRNPDTKWSLTRDKIDDIRSLQASILGNYTRMVKIGGKFVYSTCSILPSENQNQIESFLAAQRGFILEEEKAISPAQSGFDGFYMARMKRVK